MEKKDGETV
jgi:hypothetical protein